jgi:hypothetical protein
MSWVGAGFTHPAGVDLPTGHRIRPLRESDIDIDYPAVMGSRERLWAKYGEAWGWPTPSMTYADDREDLARHEAETAAGVTFAYAVVDEAETRLVGCVYVDPPDAGSPAATDAVASWWVVDDAVGTPLERAIEELMPRWLADVWGLTAVHWFP